MNKKPSTVHHREGTRESGEGMMDLTEGTIGKGEGTMDMEWRKASCAQGKARWIRGKA
jgi:hypothetical protein